MKCCIVLQAGMLKRNFKILVFALFLSPAILHAQEIDSALINYNLIDSYTRRMPLYMLMMN